MKKISDIEIKEKLSSALEKFYKENKSELEIDVNEDTLNCKLACILKKEFKGYKVHCFYNRHKKDIKKMADKTRIFPDIIVHIPDTDENNLLAIEVKKKSNKSKEDRKQDVKKLKDLTGEKCDFHYQLGVFIDLDRYKNEDTVLTYYKDGKKEKSVRV